MLLLLQTSCRHWAKSVCLSPITENDDWACKCRVSTIDKTDRLHSSFFREGVGRGEGRMGMEEEEGSLVRMARWSLFLVSCLGLVVVVVPNAGLDCVYIPATSQQVSPDFLSLGLSSPFGLPFHIRSLI